MVRSGLAQHPVGPVGYVVGYALAEDHLRQGLTVIVESVSPSAVTRDSWRRAGAEARASVVKVEVVCSDEDEHRERVATRTVDIPGLLLPDGERVRPHEYEPWNRDRIVLDTAGQYPDASLAVLLGLLGDRPADVG
ncbi:adenylyl-sulfate kinase [Streptomyces sp. NPDC058011]|uniref:AAA family ATPase n=1 Tax=Streptomyces sp. NPDC058011 TaxID=3346305 RepID=UPI0036EEABFE